MVWNKSQNKRKHKRVTEFWDIAYQVNQSIKRGVIKNISVTGCYILLEHKPEVGEQFDVALLCHTSGALEFSAIVKWHTPEGIGVEFIQPVPHTVSQIFAEKLSAQ